MHAGSAGHAALRADDPLYTEDHPDHWVAVGVRVFVAG